MPKSIRYTAWVIWLVSALFYGIEFFQRVSPTVMAKPIMHSFHIDATVLSSITALYLYAYAIAQIPVGVLLDRFGVRRPLTLACLAISLGSLLFALSHHLVFLGVARILIGFGSAFAFIGTLKLVSSWFPASLYPVMVGLTNTLGVLGAIAGEGPFAALIDRIGWENSLILISLIGLGICGLIYAFIKDHPLCLKHPENCEQLLRKQQDHSAKRIVRDVIASKQTWLTACYAGLMVTPIIAFAELWGVPFLQAAYHLSSVTAANINTAIFIGIGVGGPLNGLLARLFKRRKLVMMIGNLMALGLLCIVLYGQHIPLTLLFICMFAFGFFTSSMLLAFTINKQNHPESHNATVLAATNMVIMLMGALYQPVIGFLLDHLLPHHPGQYHLADYEHALTLLPITLVVTLILLWFIRDKNQGMEPYSHKS